MYTFAIVRRGCETNDVIFPSSNYYFITKYDLHSNTQFSQSNWLILSDSYNVLSVCSFPSLEIVIEGRKTTQNL